MAFTISAPAILTIHPASTDIDDPISGFTLPIADKNGCSFFAKSDRFVAICGNPSVIPLPTPDMIPPTNFPKPSPRISNT